MNNKVNYNKIAKNYDQRYLENPHQGALNALRRLLRQGNIQKVLEVGCGTGYWLKALKSIVDVHFFGLDSSYEMLKMSEALKDIGLCLGFAEWMPFPAESIDFVFCINALHHFAEKILFFQECNRILSKEGKLAVIGMDPRDIRNRWYIYEYFEGTYTRDLARFPSWSKVMDWFSQYGFEEIQFQDVEMIHEPKYGMEVLEDPFLEKSGCSQLSLLSNIQYEKGLRKVRNSLKGEAAAQKKFENDIVLSILVGKKTS